jgi:hypothetical protein
VISAYGRAIFKLVLLAINAASDCKINFNTLFYNMFFIEGER